MKKLLLTTVLLSIMTSTVFAGYNEDMAYMRGGSFVKVYGDSILPKLDNSIKSKNNWDLCVYLLQDYSQDTDYPQRNTGGHDRKWVEGCAFSMQFHYTRRGRR